MKRTLLLLSFLLCAGSLFAQTSHVRVKTVNGILEGIDESGVKIFKGVPYAAPPVGNLRWKAPQPMPDWQNVRLATDFGPNPMQQAIFGDMNFGTKNMSEDCLYLNIWTPAHTMKEALPVLIYFNGGGLTAGSGSEPRYAGESMARHGIISITANFRQGIFGFFAHPELSQETTYKGSGNYGFLDQVAAIEWVKENIKFFGGDPNQITIVGESAGAMSVSALMASPLAKGKFARAIGSSGSVLNFDQIATLSEAEAIGVTKAQKMGCKNLKELRALSAEELMERAAVTPIPPYNVDGYFMKQQPREVYQKGLQAKVPLLVGGNSLEMPIEYFMGGQAVTISNLKKKIAAQFGQAQVDKILAAYQIKTDDDVKAAPGCHLAGDLFIGFSTWKWGDMHASTSGQPVYRYNYCHPRPSFLAKGKVAALAGGVVDKKEGTPEPPAPQYAGASHSSDIEYAMGNLPTNRLYDWQPEDYRISEIFQGYYLNFVKTGNPNGLGLTSWAEVRGNQPTPVLQIDTVTYQKSDSQLDKRYRIMDTLVR